LSDTTALTDPRPKTLRKDVEIACEAASVIALTISVELNVYQHVHLGHMIAGIGWTVGIAVPLLVALMSHVTAHVNFHPVLKVWVGGIVAALMYVSASAGLPVLAPAMGKGPAMVASYGMDLAALTMVGTLMYSAAQKAALGKWEERREARRLQSEQEERERAAQAEREALMERFGRRGNTGGNSRGNAGGNTGGNAAGGNTAALQQGNAARPELPPAAPGEPAGDARVTGPLATVTDLTRRPAMADDVMWTLAMKLADELEKADMELTNRAFMDEYGGTPRRVAPIVKAVKEARAAEAGQNAAGE
jgi:hypothetical protein